MHSQGRTCKHWSEDQILITEREATPTLLTEGLTKSATVHSHQRNNVGIRYDDTDYTDMERCLWHGTEQKRQSGRHHIGSHL